MRDVEDQVRFIEEHILNNMGHNEGQKIFPVSQDFPVYIFNPEKHTI